MNTVPYFLLGMPIQFKGICTIYPLSIEQRISFEDKYISSIFLPYMISEEYAKEETGNPDVFHMLISDKTMLPLFCESFKVFCKSEKLHFDESGNGILFDDNTIPLESSSFKEFCKIIRDWNYIKPQKADPDPVFKTDEGRKQWLKLKEFRAKNAKIEDDSLGTMINIVQFGGSSYIDESIIKKWTMWKIVNAYHAIVGNREYEHSFYAYWKNGKKELVKQHWTERLKPNLKIK